MAKKLTQKSNKAKAISKRKSNPFFRNINLRSKKTQLLLVLLTFALVGGGIMTYRSFAATSDYVYKPSVFDAKDIKFKETQGNKSGSEYMYFSTGNKAAISAKKKVDQSGFYRLCLISRSDRAGSSLRVSVFDNRNVMLKFGSNSSGTINIFNSKDYSARCETNHIYLEAGKSYSIHISRKTGSHIRVAYAVFQRVTTNQPSSK